MAKARVEIDVKTTTDKAVKDVKRFTTKFTMGLKSVARAAVKAAAKTGRAFGKISKGLAGMARRMLSMKAAAVAAFVGWGIGKLGKSFFDTAVDMEKFEVTLGTVLKSTEKAKDMMKFIIDFAKKTPFEIPGLVEAATRLSAYGLDAKSMMTTLGDASGALGKGIMQAVEMIADASQGEFERMKEFGMRASDVAVRAGFASVKEMTSTRENLIKGTETIMMMLEERYAGGMEKLSATMTGMISNLGDQWTMFQKAVMDAGLFEFLSGKMQDLLKWVNELKDSGQLDVWAKKISDGIVKAWKAIEGWLRENWPTIKQIFQGIGVLAEGSLVVIGKVSRGFSVLGNALGVIAATVVVSFEKAAASISRFVDKILGWVNKVRSAIRRVKTFVSDLPGGDSIFSVPDTQTTHTVDFKGKGSTEKGLVDKIQEINRELGITYEAITNVWGVPMKETLDFSSLTTGIELITSLSTQMANLSARAAFFRSAPGGLRSPALFAEQREAKRVEKLYELTIKAFEAQIMSAGRPTAAAPVGGGEINIHLGGVNITTGNISDPVNFARTLDDALANEIRYGRSAITGALREVGL